LILHPYRVAGDPDPGRWVSGQLLESDGAFSAEL